MVLGSLRDEFRAAPDAATRHVPRTVTSHGVASPRVHFNIKTGSSKFAQSKAEREKGLLQMATWNVRSLLNFSGPMETAFVRGELSKNSKKFKKNIG